MLERSLDRIGRFLGARLAFSLRPDFSCGELVRSLFGLLSQTSLAMCI